MNFNKQILNFICVLFFVSFITSCSDDDNGIDSEVYVKLGVREKGVDNLIPENYEFTADRNGISSVSCFMYSNIPQWVIEPEGESR